MFNTITTSGHSSLETYASHFIWKGSKGLLKVLLCERWVGDWTKLQHIDPNNSSGYNSISFPFSLAAQPGVWGPSLCWDIVLISVSSLQLIWLPVAPGLYNYLTSTYLLWASHLHSIQPVDSQGYPLISSTGYTCYLHRYNFFFWQLGRGQYVKNYQIINPQANKIFI